MAAAQLAVAPDANRCVTVSRVLYFCASRFAPVNRRNVRRHVHIEQARLPKTLSYPARSSQIEAALAAASVRLDTQLTFSISKIFFDAHFWPATRRISYERLYIRVGTVKAADAQAARAFMVEQALHEMVSWIGEVLALPVESPARATEHYFKQDWDGDV